MFGLERIIFFPVPSIDWKKNSGINRFPVFSNFIYNAPIYSYAGDWGWKIFGFGKIGI